jgi:hypothetical protein
MSEAEPSSLLEAPPPASSSFATMSQRTATLRSLSTRPAPRVPSGIPGIPEGAAIPADPVVPALLGAEDSATRIEEQGTRR